MAKRGCKVIEDTLVGEPGYPGNPIPRNIRKYDLNQKKLEMFAPTLYLATSGMVGETGGGGGGGT